MADASCQTGRPVLNHGASGWADKSVAGVSCQGGGPVLKPGVSGWAGWSNANPGPSASVGEPAVKPGVSCCALGGPHGAGYGGTSTAHLRVCLVPGTAVPGTAVPRVPGPGGSAVRSVMPAPAGASASGTSVPGASAP